MHLILYVSDTPSTDDSDVLFNVHTELPDDQISSLSVDEVMQRVALPMFSSVLHRLKTGE